MVLQTASQFERFGETSLTGDIVSLALVRELGPAITGLLVAGRNASGMASELGSMLVTEQVDAMRAMGTDPNRKLVAPRVVATMFVLPLLTAMADFVGLTGGFIVSYFTLRIGAVEFWTRALNALEFSDLMQGMAKPVVFAFLLGAVYLRKFEARQNLFAISWTVLISFLAVAPFALAISSPCFSPASRCDPEARSCIPLAGLFASIIANTCAGDAYSAMFPDDRRLERARHFF